MTLCLYLYLGVLEGWRNLSLQAREASAVVLQPVFLDKEVALLALGQVKLLKELQFEGLLVYGENQHAQDCDQDLHDSSNIAKKVKDVVRVTFIDDMDVGQ